MRFICYLFIVLFNVVEHPKNKLVPRITYINSYKHSSLSLSENLITVLSLTVTKH